MNNDTPPIRIASDLDGTIIDHTKRKIAIAKKYGYTLTPRDTAAPMLDNAIGNEEHARMIKREVYRDESAGAVNLMPHAVETLRAIQQKWGPVAIISRRSNDHIEQNPRASIARALRGIVDPRLIFFVERDEEKDTIARELGVRAYIDDRTGALDAMPSVRHRFLFDPHGIYTGDAYQRVADWDMFGKIIISYDL